MAEEVVGIHPHKAAALVGALRASATSLRTAAGVAREALAETMEELDPVLTVLHSSDWMDDRAHDLQRILDDIWLAELGVPPVAGDSAAFGVEVWHSPYSDAFDHPVDAMRMAREAQIALSALVADGDPSMLDEFTRLFEQWRDDAVFAGYLGNAFEPVDVADLLRQLDELAGYAPDDVVAASRRAAIESVFALMATSSLFGTLAWSFDDVVHVLDADFGRSDQGDAVVPRAERQLLALLFDGSSTWDDDVLLAATAQLVLPANAHARDLHVPQSNLRGHDPRATVLSALARNPLAAQRALRELPLDDLLGSSNAYEDGGRAVGNVLIAATSPGEGDPARAMRRLVEWTAAHRDLPPLAIDALGTAIVPYLGAFRTAAFDGDPSIENPLPGIDLEDRVAVLDYASTREDGSVALRTGELLWMHRQFTQTLGEGYDGRGVAVVASVDTMVSDAIARGELSRAQDADRHEEQVREVWEFAIGVIIDRFNLPVGNLAEAATIKLIDRYVQSENYVEHFAQGARAQAHADRAIVEMMFISALWQQRARNHVFDAVPFPPELLVDDPPRIKAFVEMSDDEITRYQLWKQDDRVKAATRWQELSVWGAR